MNKGQIYGELRDFLGVLQNSIKSDEELRREIMDLGRFR